MKVMVRLADLHEVEAENMRVLAAEMRPVTKLAGASEKLVTMRPRVRATFIWRWVDQTERLCALTSLLEMINWLKP